MMGEKELKRIE